MRVPVFLSFFLFIYSYSFCQISQTPCSDVFYDSFEFDLNQWQQIGHDCNRSSMYSSSGMYGLQLRDNSQIESSISTYAMDLSSYNAVNFNFEFLTKNFEDQESFMLEVSIDDGKTFHLQENWVYGIDFENNIGYSESFNIVIEFSEKTIFRFVCNGSNNKDQLFLDEVVINNCPSTSGRNYSNLDQKPIMDLVAVSSKRQVGALMLRANQAREKFTIYMDLLRGKSGSVEVYNKTGAKLSRSIFNFDHSGELSFPIDYLDDGNYSVCVKSCDDKLYVLRLVVGS